MYNRYDNKDYLAILELDIIHDALVIGGGGGWGGGLGYSCLKKSRFKEKM